ncbi:hypothetical protein GPL21_17395 [Bradyrhizobium pachyrhizi]|uniref:Uncharacterized protein n=1 Tax=Bradyrhizobium pachyrhizi TaxID=280333 RepID=A0A844SLQ3_9BRAD|nr:hypothetical protein [Bradyrhizobium pachyrhizi]MVT66877.1 hypothetical protein [Bradyrhizobium pachyrhizi]
MNSKSAVATSNKWRENLPPNCPPKDAGPLTPRLLLRLTSSSSFTDDDFKSHAALGKPCLGAKLCEWSSCSMFLEGTSKAQLDDLRKYPNLRSKNVVAFVKIDSASGEGKVSTGRHVDFWMYRSFSPRDNIDSWVTVDDYK